MRFFAAGNFCEYSVELIVCESERVPQGSVVPLGFHGIDTMSEVLNHGSQRLRNSGGCFEDDEPHVSFVIVRQDTVDERIEHLFENV